jgi:hypothetical protein
MNIHIREAVHVDATGVRRDESDFYVPNRLIRWVQIPTEIDIKESIRNKFGKFRPTLSFSEFLSVTNNLLNFNRPTIPYGPGSGKWTQCESRQTKDRVSTRQASSRRRGKRHTS